MAQEYLPAPSNIRLADLMKEHDISQPELAKEIGCSKSTISRFISGAKGTLTHEQVLKIARLFNVSTDFLLGETNIPDRKNYDIAELGLSVEAAKNLYTGRVNIILTSGWSTIPLTKLWAIRIWQKMYCKRCFCTLPKIFLKFIEKTVTNSLLISLVVVEAVHMICFANNEKNCWKMSQTNQMPLRCRMMQQLAPITLNV